MNNINKKKIKILQFKKRYFRRIYILIKKKRKNNKSCNIF